MMSRRIIFLLVVFSHGVNFVTAEQSLLSSWMDEQIDNWKILIEWKDLVEQQCDVSDAEEYWRSLFKCPDYSQIKCLEESSAYVETGRLNCTFITCGGGRYTCSDKNGIQGIYRQQFDEYKKLMAFYKKEMEDCKPRLCSVTAGDTLEFTTAATIPYEFTDITEAEVTIFNETNVIESDGNWTVFQRRQDGSVNFYRNWNAYASGFGDPEGEFWLGLEAIHNLTKEGEHELLIEMIERDGTYMYARYSNFSVGSSQTNYILTVGGYSGNSTDSLANKSGNPNGIHDQQPFTTYDADNDNKPSANCAQGSQGAWWYNYCQFSNLNGVYDESASFKSVRWFNQDETREMVMAFTEMKTRPKV